MKLGVEFIEGDFKDLIWLKIKKVFLNIERDVYISFVYLSPENSSYTKKIEYDSSRYLKNHITVFIKGGGVLIFGDQVADQP